MVTTRAQRAASAEDEATALPRVSSSLARLCAEEGRRCPSPSPSSSPLAAKRAMTCGQELANAVSMCAPLLYAALAFERARLHACSRVVLVACACHLPFSLAYHVRAALGASGAWPLPCAIDNAWRRLDQSAIHAACAAWAFALSGGRCALYALGCAAFNAAAIGALWERGAVRPARNQARVAFGMALYLAPLAWRGETRAHLAGALAWVAPGLACFCTYRPCGGYSHALFHAFGVGVLHHVVGAAQALGAADALGAAGAGAGACSRAAFSGALAAELAPLR